MPAELIRRPDSTAGTAQTRREATPTVVPQPQLPAVAENQTQSESRTALTRETPSATEQSETDPPDDGHSPIVIFGYRLW
jgi:hypothetical protein